MLVLIQPATLRDSNFEPWYNEEGMEPLGHPHVQPPYGEQNFKTRKCIKYMKDVIPIITQYSWQSRNENYKLIPASSYKKRFQGLAH